MPTYNTYQEAKIANPNSNIIQSSSMGGLFKTLGNGIFIGWSVCDPADHCMTVEKFLADGHELVDGDLYLNLDGLVITYKAGTYNSADETGRNKNRHILRAVALEEKPTSTKFVKVEESIFDLKGEFERGELYCKNLCVSDDYTKLNTEVALFGCASAGNVYRKVEIDWRDEVNGYFLKTKVLGIDCTIEESIEADFYNDEFISLCHLVASLTEKPAN